MARTATVLGFTYDAWDDRWDVRERRSTDHGFELCLGWPSDQPRGKGQVGGLRVIVTPELNRHFELHRLSPCTLRLPIARTTIRRIRQLPGHHAHVDRTAWWEERADDLASLSSQEFSERHGVSVASIVYARHALFGPARRPSGWWREPDVAAIIRRPGSSMEAALSLGVSAGTIRRLRAVLACASAGRDQTFGHNGSERV